MSQPRPSTPTSSGPTRRQVLRGGAAAAVGLGAAMTVSACAGGSQDDTASGEPRTLDNPVTVAKEEVPVGGGVILTEDRLVVTQPDEGEFHAFSAICTHQGCVVSLIRNDAIVCGCHTSRFALDDGSRISGPAQRGLPAIRVSDAGETLQVG